ncbi:MAG TPA: hypothetical protein VII58_14275 [Acidobacteriaceae bacterium]
MARVTVAGLGLVCAPGALPANACAQAHAAAIMQAGSARAGSSSAAGPSWIARWQARAAETEGSQPHWATPVATSTPRIDQAMRTEFARQTNAAGYRTWNLGNNKGLELIPARHTELIFGVPPFFEHAQPGVQDGFGDVWFQGKYRLAAANEQHGNYALTASANAIVPTGKHGNGICCAVVTPGVVAGKGRGRWAVIVTLNGTLPVTNAHGLGHTIAWNNAIENRLGAKGFAKILTPEIEINSSFYLGGANNGKAATFVTPGIVVGRISLSHDAGGAPGRRAVTLAAGEQIAVTHYHPYNHALIVSVRLPF